jgi:hypothetical protein
MSRIDVRHVTHEYDADGAARIRLPPPLRERHQPVAQELVDRPFVPVDGLGHEPQRPVQQLVHRLRAESFSEAG